ncbi:hypothetical protein HDV05_004585 [Chytridiales sp. JEL 0842]|nr:hypothetical protein HDV05_004585 [Chytridiales sp. JEL 0842]
MHNASWVDTSKLKTDTSPATAAAAWADPKLDKLYAAADLEKTKLLKLAQGGIPNDMRGKIYCKLLKVDKMDEYEKGYEIALKRTHGAIIPEEPLPPLFGGRTHRSNLALTKEGQIIADHILCILAHDFPSLEYCPFVAPLTTLLCHHLETPDEVLGAMVSLVKQALHKDSTKSRSAAVASKTTSTKDWKYFPTYRKDTKYMARAFSNLLYKQNPKLYQHIAELQAQKADPIWTNWLTDLFLGVLPMPLLWRVLDAFLVDGYKTLFRIGVALILSQKDAIMKCTNIDTLILLLTDASCLSSGSPGTPCLPENMTATNFAVDAICNAAWPISISVADIRNGLHHHLSLRAISQSDDIHEAYYKYQRGIPKLRAAPPSLNQLAMGDISAGGDTNSPTGSIIIKDEHWIAMWSWIPPYLRVSELELVFTTNLHGWHLSTFFQRTEHQKPMILVIQSGKSIFGAFLADSWPTDDADRSEYYGTGRDLEAPQISSGSPEDDKHAAKRDFIRDRASFFMRATRKDISIGGGGDHIGLWLDGDLTNGTTGPCLTFENDPLTGNGEKRFQCSNIEVFAFH